MTSMGKAEAFGGALPLLLTLGATPAEAQEAVAAPLRLQVIAETLEITPEAVQHLEPTEDGLLIELVPEAAARFAALTRSQVGRPVTFVAGERIVSAPVLHAPIESGRMLVSGLDEGEVKALLDAPAISRPAAHSRS